MKPSILTLGVDLKFTENGRPVVIEVNGSNSGAEGLASLLSHALEDQRNRAIYAAGFADYDVKSIESEPLSRSDLYSPYFSLSGENCNDAMRFPRIDTTSGLTLRERMLQSFFRFREHTDEETLREKTMILEKIEKGIQDWARLSPNYAILIRWIDRILSENQYPISKELIPLSFIGGVARYGLVEDIGLVFDVPEKVEEKLVMPQLKPHLPSLMACVYKYFPVKQRQLIAVHPHDASKVWTHPAHVYATKRLSEGEATCRPPLNSFELEKIVDDKWEQKRIIPKDYQVPSMLWDGDFGKVEEFLYALRHTPHPLLDPVTSPFVVLKNRVFSSGGRGVLLANINDTEKIYKSLPASGEGVVIEGFAPSRPVRNRRTKEEHDSCMRFRIDCLVNGTITRVQEAVYNRLSPVPLGGSKNVQDIHIINRTGTLGAIAQVATRTEVAQGRKVVWEIIHRLLENPALFETPQTCRVYS